MGLLISLVRDCIEIKHLVGGSDGRPRRSILTRETRIHSCDIIHEVRHRFISIHIRATPTSLMLTGLNENAI